MELIEGNKYLYDSTYNHPVLVTLIDNYQGKYIMDLYCLVEFKDGSRREVPKNGLSPMRELPIDIYYYIYGFGALIITIYACFC